jgi:Ni/Fe-hydrogenase subunit HybB-like protein
MLVIPKIRNNKRGLYYSALFAVIGFVLNRMNVSVTSLERHYGVAYFPSWMEVSVTLMVVALGFGAFAWAAKNLAVFPEAVAAKEPVRPESYEVVLIEDDAQLKGEPSFGMQAK